MLASKHSVSKAPEICSETSLTEGNKTILSSILFPFWVYSVAKSHWPIFEFLYISYKKIPSFQLLSNKQFIELAEYMFLLLNVYAKHPQTRKHEYMNSSVFLLEAAILAKVILGSFKTRPQAPFDSTWKCRFSVTWEKDGRWVESNCKLLEIYKNNEECLKCTVTTVTWNLKGHFWRLGLT
jgi:hypothetical protein